MIVLRNPEGGSTDTARESGREYTKMHTAMTKGSFQACGDMQPTDLCLARQGPLITLHCCMSTLTEHTLNRKQSKTKHEHKHCLIIPCKNARKG